MRSATSICSAAASSRSWAAISRLSPIGLTSVASRLEGVPAVLDAARVELGSMPARPPSRLHTEMAIKQLPGIVALADDAVAQADAAADQARRLGDPAAAEGRGRDGAGGIESFEAWLGTDLLPRSLGEGRLGAELLPGSCATPSAATSPRTRSWPRPASSTTPCGPR